jgi:peptide/nickel transport system permease protein
MTTDTLPAPRPGLAPQIPETQLREMGRWERVLGPEWYRIIRGVFVNPLTVAGLSIVLFFLLVATFAPVLAPKVRPNADPYVVPRDGFSPEPEPPGSLWERNAPPVPGWYRTLFGRDEWVHLMGTTSGQWDIFYGVVWGTRTALFAGVMVTFTTVAIGMIIGSIAAFYGGWIDEILMRFVEIVMAFPFLLAALTLSAILVPKFGRSIWPPMIALIAFGWTRYARVIRGEILSAKERDYVLAARVVGSRDARLIIRHILPNTIYPILVLASFRLGDAVLSFAALSFLGVGTEVGYAEWGQIIAFARDWILNLDTHWYIIVFPGMALIIFGLGWNLIGDGLRDILDPRLRGERG